MKLFHKRAGKNSKMNFWTFFPLGKKGMLDDLFDLIFTVVISFFLLFFVNAALLHSVQQGQQASLQDSTEMNKALSALANKRIQINLGLPITGCGEYYTKEDCENDAVGLYAQSPDYCRWNEAQKVCQYVPEVVVS